MGEPELFPDDLIAVGPHGVYAICVYEPGHSVTRDFVDETLARGNRIERVSRGEAVERHLAYLKLVSPPSQPDPVGSSEGER